MKRDFVPEIDFSDPPFGIPPDVVLDVPVPPSVNRTRKVNRAASAEVDSWKISADALLMASGQFRFACKNPIGPKVKIGIIFCEKKCRLDLDNGIKTAIDYLRRIELIKNDNKKFVRDLHITWGHAPEGCRIVLRSAA